ncbi:hypothetical protein ABZY81_44315, partial [Streptomyces sp. NPDC006514]
SERSASMCSRLVTPCWLVSSNMQVRRGWTLLIAIEAMKSKYTKLLIENFLLSPLEMTDTATMAGLQKNVYPLYDELKDLRGLNGVKDHLSYVSSKQEAYSKRNVAKYLKKAIEQYLPTVKRHDF